LLWNCSTAPDCVPYPHPPPLQLLSFKVQFKLNSPAEAEELLALRQALSTKNRPTRDINGFRRMIVCATAAGGDWINLPPPHTHTLLRPLLCALQLPGPGALPRLQLGCRLLATA
jgi:hypothetical protein